MTRVFPALDITRRGAIVTLAAGLAACASPNPTLYTLATVPGDVRPGAPRTVEMRSIALARYLERSQIVRSSEDYRLDVMNNEWWGEPLDTMLSRVLIQNLTQRLPGTTVFSENGAIATAADAILGINIQRLDMDRAGQVVLIAQVSISRRDTMTRSFTINVTPAAATTPALVGAMSTAVGRLSDDIVGMLVTPAGR